MESTKPLRIKNKITAAWPLNNICNGENMKACNSAGALCASLELKKVLIIGNAKTQWCTNTVKAAMPRKESNSVILPFIKNALEKP
jgi:hypothetical protein